MIQRAAILLLATILTGCARPSGHGIVDTDASYKIPAIKSAVAAKDPSAIPQLVSDLDSTDPAVRFYAISGLQRLTGETFNYRYYDEEDARRPAVERWKRWLADSTADRATK
ncbi:MAG: hypothetical protein H7144_02985 [Burkholderiales bacterium]|nr:hypothetical protein [Phycisphaerae bacterium]